MRRSIIPTAALWVAVAVAVLASPAAAQYEYIDINKPFLRKIPMAIQECVPLNDQPIVQENLLQTTQQLTDMLNFTGYFQMLDREAFLVDPLKPAVKAADINFANWTTIGAELLITGGMAKSGEMIDLEFRLFDTFSGKQLVGKRYNGKMTDLRSIIRRFCTEVVLQLTGNRGVFGSKIAFVSTGSGSKELYLCDFDGFNPEKFTAHKSISIFPAWSSDGKWLAYTTYANNKPDIFIRQVNGNGRVVIDKKGTNMTPAWAPGRFELAASLSVSGDQEIYLLTGKGKIIKRITRNWAADLSPTWSPDGKKIAFVSSRSGSPQIYVQELDSGRVERVTFEGNYNTQPKWSPVGNRIVYTGTTFETGLSDIFLIDMEDLEPVRLTGDAGNNESPDWSPDGSLIVFSSTREGPSRLYVMTTYGTDQRRLLSLPGEQSNPGWSPDLSNY
ncbi:MAG: translocation protein TolB [Deltaproteobacteria bacterium SG8_13]|nr:MAG: translocation protein TolB [Deltaproteobacteria bacterium SG8_13]